MGKLEMLLKALREEIIVWRREYLERIKSLRKDGRKIYYLDETWMNAGPTGPCIWKDESVNSIRQTILSGLSRDLKHFSSRGRRFIVCHIGSKDGFVPEAMWMFVSKQAGDYHKEMNSKSFENWFLNVLPKLEENSVIVMDNAPYHSRKLEKTPVTTTNKKEIKDWLVSKNIQFHESLSKPELLAIVNIHKSKFNAYVIDEMARSHNKIVVRLPPYHCELNPIELIWVQIKNYVAARNKSFTFNDIRTLFIEAVGSISAEKWRNCVQHVEDKVEKKMWKFDSIIRQHNLSSKLFD